MSGGGDVRRPVFQSAPHQSAITDSRREANVTAVERILTFKQNGERSLTLNLSEQIIIITFHLPNLSQTALDTQ